MKWFLTLFIVGICERSSEDCIDYKTCKTCPGKKLLNGAPCRWCPNTNSCHSPRSADGCKASEFIYNSTQC